MCTSDEEEEQKDEEEDAAYAAQRAADKLADDRRREATRVSLENAARERRINAEQTRYKKKGKESGGKQAAAGSFAGSASGALGLANPANVQSKTLLGR